MVFNMSTDREVLGRVYSVLEGTEEIPAFEEWFVGATWDDRTPLVVQLDHLLMVRSNDAELLDELRSVASNIVLGDSAVVTTVWTGTTMFEELVVGEAEPVTGSQTYRGDLAFSGT